MFSKLRNRLESEQGFTLIELLVVILIIGILAAIAIPAFLSQRVKGQDTCAKAEARTAVTAIETLYTEAGSYVTATPTILNGIEPQVPIGTAGACGTGITVTATSATYTITSGSESGNTFSMQRAGTGVISRNCTFTASKGGCKAGGTW